MKKLILFVALMLLPQSAFAYLATSDAYEKQVGNSYVRAYAQNNMISYDESYNNRLQKVSGDMVSLLTKARVPLSFVVTNDKQANAFAIPGGTIMVTAPMLDMATTDDELAAIISHEIGHQQNAHWRSQIDDQTYQAIGRRLAGINDARGNFIGMAATSNYNSMKNEWEADEYAFQLLSASNYNVGAGAVIFRKFYERFGEANNFLLVNFLQAHPDARKRVEKQLSLLTKFSGGKVKVKGATVYLKGKPIITPIRSNGLSSECRAYYIAGRLAGLSHYGNLGEAYVTDDGVFIGDSLIIENTDNSEAIAKNINNALNS